MVILSILVFLLISCRFASYLGTPTPAARHQWIKKWLNDPTCQPPCWEHIIPGETSLLDAASIVSTIPDTKIILLPNMNTDDQKSQLQWQLDNSSDTGIADPDEKGKVIALLTLSLGSDQQLLFGEVISAYGQPSDVVLYDCQGEITRSSCVVHIVYPDLGMVLELFLRSVNKEGYHVDINSDANVSVIMFIPGGSNSYSETILHNLNKPRIGWKGYAEYP